MDCVMGSFCLSGDSCAEGGGNPVDCQHGELDEFNGPNYFNGPNHEETKAV